MVEVKKTTPISWRIPDEDLKDDKIFQLINENNMLKTDLIEAKEELERRPIELERLQKLFEYTYEIKDVTWEIRMTLQQFPQEYLGLLIRILELYKKELIENSFRAYPMNVDALNCRNGSVTVLGDLIKLISGFRHKTQDMEYRDDGTLREDLRKANEKLKENPLDSIK